MASSRACPLRSRLVALVAALLSAPLTAGLAGAQGEPRPGLQRPGLQRHGQQPDKPPAEATRSETPPLGAADQQRPADVAALFRHFAQIRGLSARYTEEKHLSLLAVPLKSRGRLHFLAPLPKDGRQPASAGYLSRIVEAPEPAKLTISERELRMAGKDGVEIIDLRQSDRVRLFVTSLLRVFQGDGEALAEHYHVRYTPDTIDSKAWQLELVPRQEPLTSMLQKLVLFGTGKAVTRIELHEQGGDRTVTEIVEVDAQRTFSVAEQQELFGIEAAATADRPPGGQPGKTK